MSARDGLAVAVSRRRILLTTAAAFASALLVLVAFVLPAEYAVDPLGSGRLTGLLALAEPPQTAFAPGSVPYVRETVRFHLEPFESVEYKYRLERGDALVFAWQAGAEVLAELHAEPDDAPEGFAESYDRARSAAARGSYRAAFPGWHGWFWENRNAMPVTLTLTAAGFYSAARTYSAGHVLEEPRGPDAPVEL